MPIKALLAIGAAAAGMALLAWPTPREEKPGDAIQVVHGGLPSPPAASAWAQPGAVVVSARGSPPSAGAYSMAHYAWEGGEAADDDPPGNPGIWATPAEFAPAE